MDTSVSIELPYYSQYSSSSSSFECYIDEIVIVRGSSMSPLIEAGSEILVQKGYYNCHDVKRGDIVVFDHPSNSAPLLKRVVGISGDLFEYVNGSIYINGEIQLNSEGNEYDIQSKMLALYASSYPIIPDSMYLVLGDREGGTKDASRYGYVGDEHLVGRVVIEE